MLSIYISDIQEGMILGEDIYSDNGILILSSGTILKKNHIESIADLDVSFINIMQKEATGHKEIVIVENKIQKKYENTVKSFKSMYNKIKIGNKIAVEEVNEILKPMIEEISNNPDITKKLWQIENCDEYTFDHSVTTSLATGLLGKWLNLDANVINDLALAGLMHDIGKCNIPDEILNKPDQLSDEEFRVMKTHSTLGYVLLMNNNGFSDDILQGVLQHHERYDGNGYPNNIKGQKIHHFARIVAIADVYSAMTSDRIYRNKKSPFLVAKLILENSFGYLDPYYSNVFLNEISHYYIGNIVKLNDNRIGEVVMINKNEPYRPLVSIDGEFVGLTKNHKLEIASLID